MTTESTIEYTKAIYEQMKSDISKIEKIEQEHILGILCNPDPEVKIPWEYFISKAQWCIKVFSKEGIIHLEKIQNKSKLTFEELKQKTEQSLKEKSPFVDPFFQSVPLKTNTGETIPIGEVSIGTLQHMLKPDFQLPQEMRLMYHYALALRKAFDLMSKMDQPPLRKAFILISILIEIQQVAFKLLEDIKEKENQAKQNKKNQKQSDKKRQRLEGLKLHPKYPELTEAMEKYIQTSKGKEQRILNELIREMAGINNRVTLKAYREELLEEFREKKSV